MTTIVIAVIAATAVACVPLAFVVGTGVGIEQAVEAHRHGLRPPSTTTNARKIARACTTALLVLSAAALVGVAVARLGDPL